MILRGICALATLATSMLLQATLVGPLVLPLPVSLPAVVIAVVGLLAGISSGLVLGFAGGLLADLGSGHPIGLLALLWLGLGLLAGVLGGLVAPVEPPPRTGRPVARQSGAGRHRAQALLAGALAGSAALAGSLLLEVFGAGNDPLGTAVLRVAPAAVLDALLALLVVPLVAVFVSPPPSRRPPSRTPR
ncbi:MAG: hypothetical protein M3140_12385, partial [Actinomycetota bacterium]|nr:hypothetical protein [Actinomycetota bacterium]